jgi:hypothetical protein
MTIIQRSKINIKNKVQSTIKFDLKSKFKIKAKKIYTHAHILLWKVGSSKIKVCEIFSAISSIFNIIIISYNHIQECQQVKSNFNSI